MQHSEDFNWVGSDDLALSAFRNSTRPFKALATCLDHRPGNFSLLRKALQMSKQML